MGVGISETRPVPSPRPVPHLVGIFVHVCQQTPPVVCPMLILVAFGILTLAGVHRWGDTATDHHAPDKTQLA